MRLPYFFNTSGYEQVLEQETEENLEGYTISFQETHEAKKEKLIEYFETADASEKEALKAEIQALQKENENQRQAT